MSELSDFDSWAPRYDADVAQTDAHNLYPFAGYNQVLGEIYARVTRSPGARILDLGFGTAALTAGLYKFGCQVTGLDFSTEMIAIARQRMPSARLIQYDFTLGLPRELKHDRFDCILSTYAFHHVPDARKADLLNQLLTHLSPNGQILIGDIAFETLDQREQCRLDSGDGWDVDEDYIVYETLGPLLTDIKHTFVQISFCAGILTLSPTGGSS